MPSQSSLSSFGQPRRLRLALALAVVIGSSIQGWADDASSSVTNVPAASVLATNALTTNALVTLAPVTNTAATTATTPEDQLSQPGTNVVDGAAITTGVYDMRLAEAEYMKKTGQLEQAESDFVGILNDNAPDSIKKTTLFELAATVHAKDDLPRAQNIYAQFLDRWPEDSRVPEVMLRQGEIYREMGLNNLAQTKFYAVMTAALSLKSDQPGYYPSLVLQAQIEIAETHFMMGRYSEAADFYTRLLKQDDPTLNRPQAQYRLVHSLAAIGHNDQAVGEARDFLAHYPDAPQAPEVRFQLAQCLKSLGQNNESLQQVLQLLREEKAKTSSHPELWAYWQERAGNEIANQLYRDGDYMRALEIYVNLAQLDPTPAWQLPVQYQIGLTYERLQQPQKAEETYEKILKFEPEVGTNASPGQRAVFEMSRWRAGFLGWEGKAEEVNHSLATAVQPPDGTSTNLPTAANPP